MDYNFFILIAPVYFVPLLYVCTAIDLFRSAVYFTAFALSCAVYGFCEDMFASSLTALGVIAAGALVNFLKGKLNIKRRSGSYIVLSCDETGVTFFDGKGIYCTDNDNRDSFAVGNVVQISLDFFNNYGEKTFDN